MHDPNVSQAQKAYLTRQKRDRRLVITARLLVFILFTAQWEILARAGWIDSFIFSSPSLILKTFVKMCEDQSLFIHIAATLKETLLSFLFVVLLGLGISILLWSCPRFAKVLEPYLVILNSLPKSALAPLLIVWLGARQRTIIVAGMSVAIFGSILNLYTGFGEISPEKLKLIRTLGGNKKDELLKIVLPSSVPLILANMKVNIGLCLVGVIIGEFIGARQGLGYLIIYGSQTFLLVCILSVFLSQIIKCDSLITSLQMDQTAFSEAKLLKCALHGFVILVGVNPQVSAILHSKGKSSPGHPLCYSVRSNSVNYTIRRSVTVPAAIFNYLISGIFSYKKYKGSYDIPILYTHIGMTCFYVFFHCGRFRIIVSPLIGVSIIFHKFSCNSIQFQDLWKIPGCRFSDVHKKCPFL